MEKWSLSAEQARQYEDDGYFIVRNVIPKETAAELRGVIKNTVLMPEPDVLADADPMDPMGDSARGRESRFRKLSNYCYRAPLIWLNVHGAPRSHALHATSSATTSSSSSTAVFSNRPAPAAPPPGTRTTASGATTIPKPSTSGWPSTRQRGQTAVCR